MKDQMRSYYRGNTIYFEDGSIIEFPCSVAACLEIGDTLIVRLDWEKCQRGLFGVRDRRVMWQVPKLPWACGEYVDVAFRDGQLLAWDSDGVKVTLDPNTGEVLGTVLTK